MWNKSEDSEIKKKEMEVKQNVGDCLLFELFFLKYLVVVEGFVEKQSVCFFVYIEYIYVFFLKCYFSDFSGFF